MAAISLTDGVSVRGARRRKWWLVAIPIIPASMILGSWWFTEPLEDVPVEPPTPTVAATAAPMPLRERTAWPEGKVEGLAAKTLVLDILTDTSRRIDRMQGYTATFKKQERIEGRLYPEQTLAMKVRQQPFAIYFKFLSPKAGKEIVYAEGHHDNKVIAHEGDWTRRLVPRLKIDPNSALALANSRHPVTDAGLSKLAHKLIAFRKLDLEDPDAETILDRTTGADGRPRLRSVHLHKYENPSRPYIKVEVLYDPATGFPLQISSYDWPKSGEQGTPLLAERYTYENLAIDAPLTAIDFDPANPNYEFLRF